MDLMAALKSQSHFPGYALNFPTCQIIKYFYTQWSLQSANGQVFFLHTVKCSI